MRTALICHDGAALDQVVLARWLASFTTLAGVVVLRERPGRAWKRVRREVRRVGLWRFADVLAFRLYYRLALARRDADWIRAEVARWDRRLPPLPPDVPTVVASSPNAPEVRDFLRAAAPDLVVARCKTLLAPRIFRIPTRGTFVMHPGLCPEYRNAHGGFWALAQGEPDRVATTLLRIDAGVDTGPVYGHYTCDFDEVNESHAVIQSRTLLENLDALRAKLEEIDAGRATPLDTAGRASAEWGQPWLSKYLAWKAAARRRAKAKGDGVADPGAAVS